MNSKQRILRLFLDFLIVSFTVPFITYDTGIRCVAHPCTESAARGGLIEFFAKANNFNAFTIDYWIFIGAFVGIYFLFEFIEKFVNK